MKKFCVCLLIAVLILGMAGCNNQTAQATKPAASEPEPSYPSLPIPTAPPKDSVTEPETEAKPIGEILPINKDMVCDIRYTADDSYLQLQNPTSSYIYNYIKEQKKVSKEYSGPLSSDEEILKSEIKLLFTVGEKYAMRICVYSDDMVAIYRNAADDSSPAPFYKFPAGTYQSLRLTLQAQNGEK